MWRVVLSVVALFVGTGCKTSAATGAQEVTIDVASREQTIEGWGTSMVFWNLPETPYEDLAWRRAYRDLGLNILRINMNKEVLVDASGDLAVPVALGPDVGSNVAKMDFANSKTKVYGDMAVWLRQNALEPDRVKISGSLWSPPHWMKGPTGMRQHHVTNPSVKKPTPWLADGTDGDSIGGRLLQTPRNLEQFGRYVVAWLKGFERHYGVPMYAVSLQNELSFENPFDSATYEKGPNGENGQWWQYAAALKAVKDEIGAKALQTKFMGPHMSQVGAKPSNPWGLLHQMSYIEAVKSHPDPGLIGFLSFYNSNGYLGTQEEAVKMWAGYYRGSSAVPGSWARWTKAPGVARDEKPTWVSEVGGAQGKWLTGADGSVGQGAITVAQKIHNALVHANASAYVYWQMTGHKDDETPHSLLGKKHIANPTNSKKYSAFKHFSRYVRPGAVRVGATFANGKTSVGGKGEYDTYHGLNVSAYVHDEDGTITVVLVNMQPTAHRVTLRFPEDVSVDRLQTYLTSNDRSFAKQGGPSISGGGADLSVPPHSVLTVHGGLRPQSSAKSP